MKLTMNNMQEADFTRNIFAITPEQGTTLQDMLKPEYWAHVATKLRPNSRIEVVAEDSTWFAELFVVSVGRTWAQVSLLRFVELTESVVPAIPSAKFVIKWRGAKHKHCVMRVADNAVLHDGFATAADANKWMVEYEAQIEG